jgi:hypothetical protein
MLLLGGCSGSDNMKELSNFTMNFSGFTPVIGKTFTLKLVDTSTGDILALTTPTAVAADNFSVVLPSVIQNAHSYRIDFWVDMDDSGTVDHSPNGAPDGADQSWSVTGSGHLAGLTHNFVYNTNFVDITPF